MMEFNSIDEECEYVDDIHLQISKGDTWVCCSVCDGPMRLVDYALGIDDNKALMSYVCEGNPFQSECPVQQIDFIVEVKNDDEE